MWLQLLVCICELSAIVSVQVKPHKEAFRPAANLACVPIEGFWKGPTYTDISYVKRGAHALKLDIWLPNCSLRGSQSPHLLFPAMLFAHSGNWNSLNKTLDHSQPLHLLSKGIALVSFDYRLVSKGNLYGLDIPTTWPAQGQDYEDAMRWLRAEGQSYNIDTKQLGCWGESAGGQMCAWLATAGSKNEETRLKVAVSMFAPLCFLCRSRSAEEVFGDHPADWLFGFPSGRLRDLKKFESNSILARVKTKDAADLALVRSAEPFEWVTEDMSPMVIGHGTDDAIVPFRKSLWMTAALEQAKVDHLMIEVPHGRHMYNDWPNINETLDETIEFVLKYMKPPGSEDSAAQPEVQGSSSQPEVPRASQPEVQEMGSHPEMQDSVHAESEDSGSQPEVQGSSSQPEVQSGSQPEVQDMGSHSEVHDSVYAESEDSGAQPRRHGRRHNRRGRWHGRHDGQDSSSQPEVEDSVYTESENIDSQHEFQDIGVPAEVQDGVYAERSEDSDSQHAFQDSGVPTRIQDGVYAESSENSGSQPEVEDSVYTVPENIDSQHEFQDIGVPAEVQDGVYAERSEDSDSQHEFQDIGVPVEVQDGVYAERSEKSGSQLETQFPKVILVSLLVSVLCQGQ